MPIPIPILVVSTNEGEHLENWLDVVEKLGSALVKPIPCVADNASSDRTPGVLWNAIDAGRLAVENVLWLHRNFGFAAAQNQLIRRLGSRNQYRWFATLNIDATADPKWLERLVDAASTAQDSRVGMWGGPILEPGGLRMSSAGHALRSDGAFMDVDRNREIDGRLVSNTSGFEPFGPCFAASLWSFSLISEAGLPDSAQFLYYDDVDLAYKARLLGWRAAYVADARAYHPVPNSKRTVDCQRRLQLRGRLLIPVRYFPDARTGLLLQELSVEEQDLLSTVDACDKRPFGDDTSRVTVYKAWEGRWLEKHQ